MDGIQTRSPAETAQKVAIDDLEALRAPLTGYCYRMLGAAADTDDAVQETLIRASQKLDTFDPTRARLTTWPHRIATGRRDLADAPITKEVQ